MKIMSEHDIEESTARPERKTGTRRALKTSTHTGSDSSASGSFAT